MVLVGQLISLPGGGFLGWSALQVGRPVFKLVGRGGRGARGEKWEAGQLGTSGGHPLEAVSNRLVLGG